MRKNVKKNVKKVRLYLGLLFLINVFGVQAAGEFRPIGGRSAGMSGISVAITDYWSASNNQAGTAWKDGLYCGVFFENRFMLRELSYKAIVFSACLKPGAFSLICNHFGTSVYSEFKTGIAYSRKFGKYFSAGIQLNYYRFQVTGDYGSKNILNCEIGLIFRSGKHITAGFHCVNPVPVTLSVVSGESLPTLIQFGLTYNFSEDLLLSAEIGKDPVNKACIKIGAEYRFAKILSARAGVSSGPFRFSIGAGILISRFSIDFASEYSQVLGFSPAVSAQYQFGK